MKKIILLTILSSLLMTTYVFGWDNETFTQKKEIERNKQYPYESTTGTRYQYDLTKPGDQIRYKVDPAAQIRDNVNPRVEIDRQLHQYGGGSE